MAELVLMAAMLTNPSPGNGHHKGWFKNGRIVPPVEVVGGGPSSPKPGGPNDQGSSSDENVRTVVR